MMDADSSTPLVRVRLLGAFHVERRAADGSWEHIEKSHWEKGYIRSFFKRLLSAHGRRLDRFTLIDDLWPDPENAEPLERYLNDAAYKLRRALRPVEVLHTFGHGSGYHLANQSLLWTDADACEALIGEAERIGRTSAAALPLLEQARDYFARGDYLEGESGLWVYARRGTLERLCYRCLIWLAEAYEQQNQPGQAEMLYSQLLEDDPADEDVLCRLMSLLHRQGMTSQALRCYETTKKHLKHLGQRLSAATETFAKRLLNEPRQVEVYLTRRISQPVATTFDLQNHLNEILQTNQLTIPCLNEDMNRREAIKILGTTGASLLIPQAHFHQEIWDRLSKSLEKRPSNVETAHTDGLNRTTENHWNLRLTANIPLPILLNSVTGHLQVLLQLLQKSHPLSISIGLHSLASETSQLAGVLMFDMNYHDSARAYYQFSIDAANEVNNGPLAAAALGRMSIIHATQERPLEALSLLKEAQSLAGKQNAFTLCSWLAAEEAETYAHLQKDKDCEAALARGERFVHLIQPQEKSYGIGFTPSRLSAYRGTCYMRLHQPEIAIKTLTQDLNAPDSPEVFRRLVLVDLAEASIQSGDVDQACSYLKQSLELITHQNSLRSLGDIRKLRQRLEKWSSTQAVKELDEKLQ